MAGCSLGSNVQDAKASRVLNCYLERDLKGCAGGVLMSSRYLQRLSRWATKAVGCGDAFHETGTAW